MMRVKALILGLLLVLGSSGAWAQTGCQGQPAAGGTCGNPNATAGLPSWATMTALLDRNFGGPSTQGTMLNRGASVWSATATPVLGLNGGTGGSLTMNGATSGSAIIGVKAAAGSTTFNLPVGNGTNGFVLATDGSGNTSWANPASGGTVTSVGLSLPGIFTVTGSPVTITGTLTGTLATQSANLVWAGPNTGAASAPTFRSLVGADLPNPSVSTLGGVQSFAAVGSQWIRQISTSGVPTASQPAFTDISGVAAAAQLPNPTASTLGGVESLAAVTSKWINQISTLGVPSATQPIFSDIGGNATLAQLPAIGNGSLLSNISGGSSTPLANSLTSIIDSVIGSTQGQVLYRSGTVWTALNPGTAGQVLSTNGAAANPSWTTVTGTGTVTSVATNNGLTGGTITSSGTIGLASVSTGNVLANVSGISAAPSATTPTAVLDVIGSTQGSVLYRGASVWTALTPGTNGQFLQTQGAGSTPQWASVLGSNGIVPTSGGTGTLSMEQSSLGGRLTFSGVSCIFSTDQVAQTVLTYGPCGNGKYVPIYDGTQMKMQSLQPGGDTDAVGYTLTLGSNWAASSIFDVYMTISGGNPVPCTVQWTNSTTRATAISFEFKGIPTNATLATCRTTNSATISMAANQGTLVGWFLTNGSTGTIDFKFGTSAANGGAACICIGNVFNTQPYTAVVVDSNNAWTQTQGQTWQQKDSQNGGGGNQAVVVQGIAGMPTKVSNFGVSNASTATAQVGIGIDTCTVDSSDTKLPNSSGLSAYLPTVSFMTKNLAVGSHTICAEEQTQAGTTVTNGRIGVSASGNQTSLRLEGYY
jgi:hypothetical protein